MKISTHLKSKRFQQIAAVFLLAVASISMDSCSKEDASVAAISGLTVVNASPTLATYNLYLNSAKVNAAALPFTGTIPYFKITPGANSLKFTSGNSTESLLTKVVTLEADKAYSLFLIDKAEKLDGLLVSDDLQATNTEKALVRFVNLSPDAGALELGQTGAATLVASQAFKAYSTFSAVDAKTYSLEIKNPAGGTVLSKLENVVLTAGKMYTIVAVGMLKPTGADQPLKIQVITNK
jgi:hypothetical protein